METFRVAGGVTFEVVAETAHYVYCRATGNTGNPLEVLEGLEDMYTRGFRLVCVRSMLGYQVVTIFEKVRWYEC